MLSRDSALPLPSVFPLVPPADETALRGRPEVYVTGGFNRWTHPGKQHQCVLPSNLGIAACIPDGRAYAGRKPWQPCLVLPARWGVHEPRWPCTPPPCLSGLCHAPMLYSTPTCEPNVLRPFPVPPPTLQRSLRRCRCRAWSRAASAGTRRLCRLVGGPERTPGCTFPSQAASCCASSASHGTRRRFSPAAGVLAGRPLQPRCVVGRCPACMPSSLVSLFTGRCLRMRTSSTLPSWTHETSRRACYKTTNSQHACTTACPLGVYRLRPDEVPPCPLCCSRCERDLLPCCRWRACRARATCCRPVGHCIPRHLQRHQLSQRCVQIPVPLQTGFYDNNKGLDYHIPVQGGRGSMPTLRVVHVAAEMAPIAKVRRHASLHIFPSFRPLPCLIGAAAALSMHAAGACSRAAGPQPASWRALGALSCSAEYPAFLWTGRGGREVRLLARSLLHVHCLRQPFCSADEQLTSLNIHTPQHHNASPTDPPTPLHHNTLHPPPIHPPIHPPAHTPTHT